MNFEKSEGFKLFHKLIGFGLLTSDGKKWVEDRKVLNLEFLGQSKEFNFNVVNDYLNNFKLRWDKQEKINLTADMNELIIHTIYKILFRRDFHFDLKILREHFKNYDEYIVRQQRSLIKFPFWLPIPYFIRARRAVKWLRTFAKNVMDELLASPEPNMIKRMKENNFSDENIIDQILTLFIGGHESTSNSINFTFLLLRDNTEAFEKLLAEVNSFQEEVNPESIEKLEYLDLVIKESLRLYPTVPLFPRIAKVDGKLGEFDLKKGDLIAFSPYIMHRTEKYWPDALAFKPERFIGKKFEREFIYFPFGLGPRKCIGAAMSGVKMKQIIFFLLKNYHFEIQGPSLKVIRHNVSLSPDGDVYLFKR
jgi:cytochrome P450